MNGSVCVCVCVCGAAAVPQGQLLEERLLLGPIARREHAACHQHILLLAGTQQVSPAGHQHQHPQQPRTGRFSGTFSNLSIQPSFRSFTFHVDSPGMRFSPGSFADMSTSRRVPPPLCTVVCDDVVRVQREKPHKPHAAAAADALTGAARRRRQLHSLPGSGCM